MLALEQNQLLNEKKTNLFWDWISTISKFWFDTNRFLINSPFRNINMILNFRNQISTRRIWLDKYIKWNKSLWRKNWHLKYTDRYRWWPNIFGQYRFVIWYLLYAFRKIIHIIRSEYLDLLWSSSGGWNQAQARKWTEQLWYLRDNSIWRL